MQTIVVVISSCDRYGALWAPHLRLQDHWWPDRHWPRYLIANTVGTAWSGCRTILVGPDKSWSETLRRGLSYLTDDYVLLLLDDYFLTSRVDDGFLVDAFSLMVAEQADYVRLYPCPGPDIPLPDKRFGVIAENAPYRHSLQAAIWRREFLIERAQSAITAWDFELLPTCPSKFLSVQRPLGPISYTNVLTRGKWRPGVSAELSILGEECLRSLESQF